MLAGDCTALTPFKEGSIGPPGPGHELAIVDPETAEPTVDTGEIAVKYAGNPVCSKEYWGTPAATDAKVRNGWLLTEDLGSMDEVGYVGFQSRKDDLIISPGYRIGSEAFEDTIAEHPAVADAGVFGVPDAERGEVPRAYVIPTADATPKAELREAIGAHVRERLGAYEYPREVAFLDELPKTATGKVRRVSLRDMAGLGS
jgi:acetyl-CoA synthetase